MPVNFYIFNFNCPRRIEILVYTRYLFGSVFLFLAGVAALNFSVDPGGIYRAGGVNPQAYADALVKSEHGLWTPENSFDERLVAKALAEHSQRAECIVIGSSHVMQISSDRNPRSLQDICGAILNLGVSGAGIEDHFALAYLTLRSGRPKKIILGIDPWTFAFGKDQRWSAYRDDYFQARSEILGKKGAADSKSLDKSSMAKLANLINLEYTVRSVQSVAHGIWLPQGGAPTITAVNNLDPAVGGDYPAQLRDGSHVYSAKYISDVSQATIPIGGLPYKTDGILNQQNAVDAYRALLLWIRNQGVEPILLMTPYHENVWKAPLSANTVALRATEPIVMNLAHELNGKLIGSYDPKEVGCPSNEFYDHMHPTAGCLIRLRPR